MAKFSASARSSIEPLHDLQVLQHKSRKSTDTGRHNRRRMLALSAGIAGWLGSQLMVPTDLHARMPAEPSKSRKGLLVRPTSIDSLDLRSKIVVEVGGELRLNEPDPNKDENVRTGEVRGKSTLDYFEKVAYRGSQVVAAARRYVEAKAENWVSGSASSEQLRPACRETRTLRHNGTWEQYCESETLDLREIELLRSPVNSAVLELLLPEQPAKPTSTWSIPSEAAASIFNLDAVHNSTLSARITKVEKGVATIALTGELDATAKSVPTQLSIQGNFNAKYAGGCVVVTWLGLTIKEKREISQAEPGFTVTARVRLIRTVTEPKLAITADALRELVEQDEPGRWLVRLQSTAGRYSMLADRSWQIFIDSGEDAILRMIENNTVIAQCNVRRLPQLEEGTQLTMEGMQEEIKQSLGESFGQFLQSNERVTSAGLRLVRSVVTGSAEEVPVQWIYTHLSDDSGRRVALIFTMGGNVTDRFAAADEQMASSFQLLAEPKSDQTPTSAPDPALRSAKAENKAKNQSR